MSSTAKALGWQNLRLLGFEGRAYASQVKHFGPDMFRTSNERGLLCLVHFLLSELPPPRDRAEAHAQADVMTAMQVLGLRGDGDGGGRCS